MITITDFKNLDVYKNYLYYPLGQENKNTGTAFFLTSQNQEESKLSMNDTFVRNRMYYPGYFFANTYNFKLFNKNIRLNMFKDVTKMFVAMKSDKVNYKTLRKYSYNISQLAGINTYVDMSIFYSNFFSIAKSKKIPSSRMVKEFDTFMRSYVNNFTTNTNNAYTNNVLLINLDVLGIDIKDSANYDRTSIPNILAMIFYMIRYESDTFITFPLKILIRSGRFSILVNPAECDKDSYKTLRTNLMRIKQDSDDDELEKMTSITPVTNPLTSKANIVNNQSDALDGAKESATADDVKLDAMSKVVAMEIITKMKDIPKNNEMAFKFVGDVDNPGAVKIDNKLESKISDTVKELAKDKKISADTDIQDASDTIKDALEKDKEFMAALSLGRTNKLTNIMSPSNIARNKQLALKQSELKFEGKTIDELLSEESDQVIPVKEIKSDIINEKIKKLKLPNFDKTYNEKFYDKDIIDVLNSFKNKSVPVYILDMHKEDTSDTFNKKFTWTVNMEAADRSRHKLVFDVPKFINDSFMFLNGNKKNKYMQLFLLPISKTEPDVVQICTNYNKAFVRRLGDKLSPKTERFRKSIAKHPKLKIKYLDNTLSNTIAITSLEYDEMAKVYDSISNNSGTSFIFSLPEAIKVADEIDPKRKKSDEIIPIGLKDNNGKPSVIYLNTSTNEVVGSKLELVDYMVETLSESDERLKEDFLNENVGKKYMYTSVKIMGKDIPLILLLSYVESLPEVLRKANIKYEFADKASLRGDDKNNKGIIEFKDMTIIYDKYPLANSLLLNGLHSIPTKNYNYSDLCEAGARETYLEIFDNLFSSKKIANAFDNFYDLLLDPKTVGVLKDLNMPTDFVNVFLYANKLLEDGQFTVQTSAATNRIRSNEIVAAMVYKTLATAYEGYKQTSGNKNPQKMTIPQDRILKNILMLTTVEDYSQLGPIPEAEKARAISAKGHSGMNLDRAYTLENRSFDKSMLGILSLSSPPTGSVGMVRQLPLDSNILSVKGYLKAADSEDDINQANMCSPAEALIPMCTTKDDSPRIAMANNQSKHVVPCKKYDKLLVGTGADKIFANVISDDFAFKAKQDGVVEQVDPETKLMILKYKDGTRDFVELESKISKNGGK